MDIQPASRIERLPPYVLGKLKQLIYDRRKAGADVIDHSLREFAAIKDPGTFVGNALERVGQMRHPDRTAGVAKPGLVVHVVQRLEAVLAAAKNWHTRVTQVVVTGRRQRKSLFRGGYRRCKQIGPAGTAVTPPRAFDGGQRTGNTDGTGADEFESKDNVILVNGQEVHRYKPWREDCKSTRGINPYCRRWYEGSWSADFSRSGWCPGLEVLPEEIDATEALTPGDHTVGFRVDNVRPRVDDHHGYWRVSAYLVGWTE